MNPCRLCLQYVPLVIMMRPSLPTGPDLGENPNQARQAHVRRTRPQAVFDMCRDVSEGAATQPLIARRGRKQQQLRQRQYKHTYLYARTHARTQCLQWHPHRRKPRNLAHKLPLPREQQRQQIIAAGRGGPRLCPTSAPGFKEEEGELGAKEIRRREEDEGGQSQLPGLALAR